MTLEQYYNRFDPTACYDRTLFLAGRGLQSAELNEIQEYAVTKIKGIGDALFKEGNVVSGCLCVVKDDGVFVEPGAVYIHGAVRDVPGFACEIPLDARVHVGLWYREQTVTELEDPSLRDPAVGTRNYQEAGACRLQSILFWGVEIDGQAPDQTRGSFYPIYTIVNGILIQQDPPPQLDAVSQALARYDREANGSYVIKGLDVSCVSADLSQQVFVINEGKAHVNGFEIELPHSLRIGFGTEIDQQTVLSDPYTFDPDASGNMHLVFSRQPVCGIQRVDGTVQKTVNLTHGAFTGVLDPLSDEAVLEIVLVQQGTKTFVLGTDYKLNKGGVDWSLPGAEVAPGSTYSVTYRYRTRLSPKDVDQTGCTISGAVPGSLLSVDYSWRLPRIDVITLDPQGMVCRIKGLAHPWRPALPQIPNQHLALAYVVQTWRSGILPDVVNYAVQVIPMHDLQVMRQQIRDLFDVLAQEQLKNDANAKDPTTKKGLFVDPFFDDDLRDQGIPQRAAIVDRVLTLPITPVVVDLGKTSTPFMLPYVLEPVLEQPLQTTTMKVNPYLAFDPMPATVNIVLNVDRWVDVQTNWTSPLTQRFISGWGSVFMGTTVSTSNQLLSTSSQDATTMRSVSPNFTVSNFKSGETVSIIFDGIAVIPQPQKGQ